ncbi:hypothetical protein V1477_018804 [Vespula maculifrons]|uniref:Uncharacterized protein n=1 Tax=Vespula maculifrons TaxID=7453 RepID=A0ABD2AWG4_VESMC
MILDEYKDNKLNEQAPNILFNLAYPILHSNKITESVSKMLLKQSHQTICVHGNLQNIENLTKLTTDIFQFNTNFFLLP